MYSQVERRHTANIRLFRIDVLSTSRWHAYRGHNTHNPLTGSLVLYSSVALAAASGAPPASTSFFTTATVPSGLPG